MATNTKSLYLKKSPSRSNNQRHMKFQGSPAANSNVQSVSIDVSDRLSSPSKKTSNSSSNVNSQIASTKKYMTMKRSPRPVRDQIGSATFKDSRTSKEGQLPANNFNPQNTFTAGQLNSRQPNTAMGRRSPPKQYIVNTPKIMGGRTSPNSTRVTTPQYAQAAQPIKSSQYNQLKKPNILTSPTNQNVNNTKLEQLKKTHYPAGRRSP